MVGFFKYICYACLGSIMDKGGKGSHRNFVHPNCKRPITLSGKLGDDAKKYQEIDVKRKIEESKS